MAKASKAVGRDTEAKVKEIKIYLKSEGVRYFEPVSLFCDQLAKVCPGCILFPMEFKMKHLGNGGRDRETCRRIHCKQIVFSYQEGYC
jgi:Exoribonuclease 1 Domain-3